jgi:hypothetical protein
MAPTFPPDHRAMTTTLDVLVAESHPRVAAKAADALVAAGHRVHRCHDDPERAFPCRGLVESSTCPLVDHVDVALLVRGADGPWPTRLEDGVLCAIRTGIPVVEQGSEVVDPFTPWIARRLRPKDDLVQACEEVAGLGFESMRRQVFFRIAKLLNAVGIDQADVDCRFETDGSALQVHLDLPGDVARHYEQSLAVRVLDAVRASGRTFGQVDVQVHAPVAHVKEP